MKKQQKIGNHSRFSRSQTSKIWYLKASNIQRPLKVVASRRHSSSRGRRSSGCSGTHLLIFCKFQVCEQYGDEIGEGINCTDRKSASSNPQLQEKANWALLLRFVFTWRTPFRFCTFWHICRCKVHYRPLSSSVLRPSVRPSICSSVRPHTCSLQLPGPIWT